MHRYVCIFEWFVRWFSVCLFYWTCSHIQFSFSNWHDISQTKKLKHCIMHLHYSNWFRNRERERKSQALNQQSQLAGVNLNPKSYIFKLYVRKSLAEYLPPGGSAIVFSHCYFVVTVLSSFRFFFVMTLREKQNTTKSRSKRVSSIAEYTIYIECESKERQ